MIVQVYMCFDEVYIYYLIMRTRFRMRNKPENEEKQDIFFRFITQK